MKKKTKSKGAILFPGKLLYINLYIFILISCTSISKKAPLHSEKLSFKIRWTYFDPLQTNSKSFSSFVFLKERRFLRLDVFQNFIGVIGSLVLNDQVMIIQAPLNKEYYVGAFNSQIFFPEFPSFPSSWLIDILRAEASKAWECEKQKKRVTKCKTDFFEITWIYKRSQLYEIQLEDSMKRKITAKIQNLSMGKFSTDLFNPSLVDWTKREEPLFFQKL